MSKRRRDNRQQNLDQTQQSDTSGTQGIPPVERYGPPRSGAPSTPPSTPRVPPPPAPIRPGQQPRRGSRPTHAAPQRATGEHPASPPPRSARRGSARARRDSGLYLPLWSLGLMLLIVIAIATGIVIAIINLGGNNPSEVVEPVIMVHSPVPSERPESFPVSPATPTIPPTFDIVVNRPEVSFELAGPTLPVVEISPTPRPVSVGETVLVVDVGLDQLNVRDNPGIFETSIVFRADEGTSFEVIGGPEQIDGLTWWQIIDPFNSTRTGWAAANYLQVQQQADS